MTVDGRPLMIRPVAPEATHALRAEVLRAGQPPETARFAAEFEPGSATYAAIDDGVVVSCAVVMPETCPELPDLGGRPWRLRGMATDADLRGTGIGRAVLDAVIGHVRAEGGTHVWCNARTPARRFYERAGFAVVGDGWIDPDIGPHVRMVLDLDRR